MKTWQIVAIVVAIAFVIWFVMRKHTLPALPPPTIVPIPAAPGVMPSSGAIPTPPAPPPPGNTTGFGGSVVPTIKRTIIPSALLQHVPVIGGAAATLVRAPTKVAFAVTDKVNNTLSNIPVAGKALAAPGKVLTSVAKSISSWF